MELDEKCQDISEIEIDPEDNKEQTLYMKPFQGYSVTKKTSPEQEIFDLIKKAESDHWLDRINAFDQLASYISNKASSLPNVSMFCKIVNLHFDHLDDPHFKVILVVHKSFGKLIHSFGETLEPYLSEIIPRLLINLSDKREKVNSSANFLLNLLIQRYGGDKLLKYFVSVLDIKEDVIVIGAALEVLSNQLIKATDEFFKEKSNIKKTVKRIGRIIVEFSTDKTMTMPALGCLLALRDLETSRTIKAILNLPSQQLDIIRDLSDSYAPDLASNLSSQGSTDVIRQDSNSTSNYSNVDRISPSRGTIESKEIRNKTTPFFHDYDQVMSNEEPNTISFNNSKQSSSHGFMEQKFSYGSQEIGGSLDEVPNTNDSCIDCVSYLKRMSIGRHTSAQTHNVTSKSKPYYTHILVEHYNDEETIYQIIDELLEGKDATHNATELLFIISNLILKEEPPVLQALIKTEKYIISKCDSSDLVSILKDVTDPLVTTFNHPHANVRKSVVFCLVELYFAVGDAFESCLEQLNPSQQKLV